jgi:peptidoglycan/xylan/chitin deacetylase (PgdA/CDA1 family)
LQFRHLLAIPALLAHRLTARPGGGVRFLLFHDVAAAEMRAFERLVDVLAREGRLGTPQEAQALLEQGRQPSGERCVITFDDGFASNDEACRVLERHGARAMLFVCPGLLDEPRGGQRAAIAARVFDGKMAADDLPGPLELLNWGQVRDLAARGHVIGSHSLCHRRFTQLTPAELHADLATARQRLIEEGCGPAEWLAFPFGDIDSISASTLAVVGQHHAYCRSGIRGLNTAATHPLALLADHVDLAAPLTYQRLAFEGGLDRRYAGARRRLQALP